MTKHTPGPWHVENKRGIANNLLRICSGLSGVARVNSNVHEEANARLIAAAPELLDALKDALCALEVCGRDFNYAMGKASAAIAKAEGGQDE